jgi:hypothetical protein
MFHVVRTVHFIMCLSQNQQMHKIINKHTMFYIICTVHFVIGLS